MKNYYKIKNDSMFKAIFTKEENRDLLERLIYECTNLEVKVISTEATELNKDNVTDKAKILDVLVKTKDEEINVEVNSYENESLRRRNASYIFKRFASGVNVGESYHDMLKYIQINLTSNLSKKSPLIDEYTLSNKENKKYIDNLIIYEINLQKAMEECYNNSKLSVIGMLDMDLITLESVKGDNLMEKLKKEAVKYCSTLEPFLPPEVEEKLLINTLKIDAKNDGFREGREEGFHEGKEEGRQEGIKEGINQTKIEVVKNLLNKNMDIDLISDVTGLSIEEIEKLK